MSKQNNNNKNQQLSKDQISQLMAAMKNQKAKPKSSSKQYLRKTVEIISSVIKGGVHFIDRFIKFIIKREDIDRNNVVQTARGPILFGTYIIIIFFLVGGLWSVLAPLDSASVALGTVIPSSKRKVIQHPYGGTVKEIYADLGDEVQKGDKILEFDEVRYRMEYENALNSYRTALANVNRLIAERDNLNEVKFDDFLLESKDVPEVQTLIESENQVFHSDKETFEKKMEAYEQKTKQVEQKLAGVYANKISLQKTKDVQKENFESLKKLYKSGIISKNQYLEAEAKFVQSESQLAQIEAQIEELKQGLLEDTYNKMSFINENKKEIVSKLHEALRIKNDEKEKYILAKDGYDKLIVRSPVNGTVIEMYATTIGGVFGQGSSIAEILPKEDRLIVEAKISHKNIDVVDVGLKAKIRFSAFKSRTTPVFSGVITSLSPDTVEEKTQQPNQQSNPDGPFYVARIEIDMEDFEKVAKKTNLRLKPGMQAEVQIVTGTRTLFRYLLDPLTDNMFKAFIEK